MMNNEEKQVKKWLNRIDTAEKHYKDYHDLIDDTRKAYKNDVYHKIFCNFAILCKIQLNLIKNLLISITLFYIYCVYYNK